MGSPSRLGHSGVHVLSLCLFPRNILRSLTASQRQVQGGPGSQLTLNGKSPHIVWAGSRSPALHNNTQLLPLTPAPCSQLDPWTLALPVLSSHQKFWLLPFYPPVTFSLPRGYPKHRRSGEALSPDSGGDLGWAYIRPSAVPKGFPSEVFTTGRRVNEWLV